MRPIGSDRSSIIISFFVLLFSFFAKPCLSALLSSLLSVVVESTFCNHPPPLHRPTLLYLLRILCFAFTTFTSHSHRRHCPHSFTHAIHRNRNFFVIGSARPIIHFNLNCILFLAPCSRSRIVFFVLVCCSALLNPLKNQRSSRSFHPARLSTSLFLHFFSR